MLLATIVRFVAVRLMPSSSWWITLHSITLSPPPTIHDPVVGVRRGADAVDVAFGDIVEADIVGEVGHGHVMDG